VTAMSGLPGQPPSGWGFSYLDHIAGYFGAIAALMALRHRAATGQGQHVDISQIETGMLLCSVPILDYQINGRQYERVGNHNPWSAVAPHSVFRCRDGADGLDRWIALAAESEEQWRALCDVLGDGDLAADARFATNSLRLDNQDALDEAITALTRSFDSRELMYLLQARGVPAGSAQNTRDKMETDPQHAARGFYQSAEHTELGMHRFEGMPMQFSAARWDIRRASPCLGQDTTEVLTRLLGYSDAEVADLVAEAAM
jgi:crotonobetainyl-CoA:carnitine CoA-transferase CaiB-like acyl-CoA transferase